MRTVWSGTKKKKKYIYEKIGSGAAVLDAESPLSEPIACQLAHHCEYRTVVITASERSFETFQIYLGAEQEGVVVRVGVDPLGTLTRTEVKQLVRYQQLVMPNGRSYTVLAKKVKKLSQLKAAATTTDSEDES